MPLERKPFENYTLDEDKGIKDKFTCRVNPQERKWLEEGKECLNVAQDSKALKLLAFVGYNVLLSTFTAPFLKYLFKKDRVKLEDFKKY